MPARNTIREDVGDSYFHVYARGSNKQPIFLELSDYSYFQMLIARYLSKKPVLNKYSYKYPNYYSFIKILAFCQMGNHFHLLIYQQEAGYLSKFMKSLMTSYSMYFNRKYSHSGAVFESRFKCSRITQQSYLEHISRYIHMNPDDWENYPYSSLKNYLGSTDPGWVRPEAIKEMFANTKEYMQFMHDYEGQKEILQEIKYDLADH